jgi:hypothetical protein
LAKKISIFGFDVFHRFDLLTVKRATIKEESIFDKKNLTFGGDFPITLDLIKDKNSPCRYKKGDNEGGYGAFCFGCDRPFANRVRQDSDWQMG